MPFTDSFEHDAEILDPKLLKKWSHLTLEARALKINRRYGVHRTSRFLAKYYRYKGITYRQTYMAYRAEETNPDLEPLRRKFALKLRNYLLKPEAVWYVDESSFNAWSRRSKAWYVKEAKFRIPYSSRRGHGETLFAAISN